MSEFPPITLRTDSAVGLFIYYDQARAEGLDDCLTDDEVEFSFDPPEAAHLALPGQAVFVFGRRHPRVVAEQLEEVGEEVVIDLDVVITEDLYQPPVKQLLSLGELRADEKQDYAALGLSRDDAPVLIRMATDEQLHGGPYDSPVVWAPVHAWRALAQVRAEEAIASLVGLFRRADNQDDWVSDDLPRALAQFGSVALVPVTAYLADSAHGDWSRAAAARAIALVGQVHSETRADCITRLSLQLDCFAGQSETLNSFLISSLMDLRAVEAMPFIERAFASGRVDESVMGDLEDVQIEFGLKSQREHPPKPNSLTIMGERFRAQWRAAGLPLPDADGNWAEPADDGPPTLNLPYIAPPKVGRNEPCPCGSGKKFKKCCGAGK